MRTYRNTLVLAAAMLGATGLAASAQAAVIYPISAVGSSSYPGYLDSNAIDQGVGSAVSDWSSFTDGTRASLDLDLGGVFTLDKAFVTDRVTSGAGNNGFFGGTTDFTTQFSLQAFTDATFTTAAGAALVFNHTTPVGPTSPSDFLDVVSLGGMSTEFVQYRVLAANGGNTGLSDIHFSTASGAVPEPASWALMILGFGAAGAMLRRRARAALA